MGEEDRRRVAVPVTGMTCAACVRRVEKALSKVDGVSGTSVNLATETATVEHGRGVEVRELVSAVEGAGYGAGLEKTTLDVTGMTCAACVGRVEKTLRKVSGVLRADVNLATEKATVEHLPGEAPFGELKRAVEGAGYGLEEPEEPEEPGERRPDARERGYAELRARFLVAAVLTGLILLGSLPMMLGVMPPMPERWLDLVLLALATPVQFWAGWRFYRGAWGALRHGTADMNTLVAVGTSAAYLYSAAVVLAPGLFAGAAGERADVYFETSALIVTLILLGRLLEARARGRTNEAIKKLAGLRAKTARVLRDGRPVDVAVGEVVVGDVFVVRPGEKVPVDGVVVGGE